MYSAIKFRLRKLYYHEGVWFFLVMSTCPCLLRAMWGVLLAWFHDSIAVVSMGKKKKKKSLPSPPPWYKRHRNLCCKSIKARIAFNKIHANTLWSYSCFFVCFFDPDRALESHFQSKILNKDSKTVTPKQGSSRCWGCFLLFCLFVFLAFNIK